MHEKLPTKLSLFHKKIVNSPLCIHCNQDESILHIFRDCPKIRNFCLSLGYPMSFYSDFFSNSSLMSWLSHDFVNNNKCYMNLPWNSCFSFALWLNRNHCCMDPSNKENYIHFLYPKQIIGRTFEFLFCQDNYG